MTRIKKVMFSIEKSSRAHVNVTVCMFWNYYNEKLVFIPCEYIIEGNYFNEKLAMHIGL